MNINFTGRGYELDELTRDYANKKISRLVRFLEEPIEIHIILEREKLRLIAEIHASHRHGVFQATEETEDMRDSIHAVIHKVEKQARRARKKFMDRRRRAQRNAEHQWPVEVLEGSGLTQEGTKRVIKKANLPIKPMTVDEASILLEQSKNEFFVFRDAKTDRVSVLYRRKDENYGLIAPEF